MVKVWAWQLCGLHKRGIEASWTLPQNISNEQIPDTDNDWCRCGSGVGSDVLQVRGALEEWGFVDERDLQNWKGGVVCMTCQHFTYGVDQHCHTMVGCNLRQKQLQQGQHLKKRCKLWAPTWQKEMGWAPEAG